MASIQLIMNYLNEQLRPQLWKDYCPNGLQVAGVEEVHFLATAVSASQSVLEQAVHLGAQAILVHHGYFWRGEDPCILGIKRQRLALLLNNNLNLIAYHLPLDGHSEWGNNVQLSKLLDIRITGEFAYHHGPAIALYGELASPMTGQEFADFLENRLHRKALWVAGRSPQIKRIGWSTGAAQDYLEQAAAEGVDAYLTGEVSERTVHIARETGLYFFSAGHHATERYGVQALGEHLATQFAIKHQYINDDNPV